MLGQILICSLAASGVLLVLWVTVGMLLMPFSTRHGSMILWVHGNETRLEQQIRAYGWLYNTGLVRVNLLVLAESDAQAELAERACTPYRWADWIRLDGGEWL